MLMQRRTFCIMGQQVNKISKLKNSCRRLVNFIRPEARRSNYNQADIEGRTRNCCISLRRVVIRGEKPLEFGYRWFSAKRM